MAGVLPFHHDRGMRFDRVHTPVGGWRANVLHNCLLYQRAAFIPLHECKGFPPRCLPENTSFRFVCFQKELFTSLAAGLHPKSVSMGSQDLGHG